ncbi:PAAR domain-containing protein [Herbaspirillum sp. RTI4]|uniref:PAAR domain-containing protein n=1 Tax=Herbaspirillum sp. RTI4 TaxID=3048640 RepID=UPI002AB5170B|nr:PAAR domain-containing protein [Herbaspirillum sp. RTI4]MDY7578173.1 PAAR domain-containing protein [Herbaspirillum sp. RTI4]MEA9980762.1 PAAR domain-containing protein [Herbaspirillum sp. RTI4]
MSHSICCEGDATTHGGKVTQVSGNFPVDGKRAARIGDWVSCPRHGDNQIVEGGGPFMEDGIPFALDGCRTQCGSAVIATARTKVSV